MHKKLMMACVAIAAFAAFVIAPAASASPVLTENGVAVPVHPNAAKTCAEEATGCITGKNTGETKFTGSINVNCSNADLSGPLTKNNGTEIVGEIPVGGASFTGTATGGDCTSTGLFTAPAAVAVTSKLCLATVNKSDNVTVTGCGSSVKFTLTLTGLGPCEYATPTVLGTYTTGEATVNINEQVATLQNTGSFCPTSGKLDMDFDLYTYNTTTPQLTIS
jgi:hypothetical protein